MNEPFLSIIVPAYNEESRILQSLQRLLEHLKSQSYAGEVLVVSDGSTDDTSRITNELAEAHPNLRLIEREHRGKGHAVKVGMLEARGAYRLLCDADQAMPVEEIPKFLPPVRSDVDVAIGSREVAGARRFNEPALRHLMGRFFNWIVRAVVLPGIKDSQCGFKCFTARAATDLFSVQRIDGFGFDVEVLFLARKSGLRVAEVPIDWYYQTESKIRPVRDTFRMLADVLSVRWNSLLGNYRRASSVDERPEGSQESDR